MFLAACARRPRNFSRSLAQHTEPTPTSSTYDGQDAGNTRLSRTSTSHSSRSLEPTSSEPPHFWHRRHLSKSIAVAIAKNPIVAVVIRARATLSDVVRSNSLKYLIAGVCFHSLTFLRNPKRYYPLII